MRQIEISSGLSSKKQKMVHALNANSSIISQNLVRIEQEKHLKNRKVAGREHSISFDKSLPQKKRLDSPAHPAKSELILGQQKLLNPS